MLLRLLLAALVVFPTFVIFDTEADACECREGPWTTTDDLEFSKLVFRGVVTSFERSGKGGGYEVDFSVVTSRKGSAGSEITVWTPDPSDQCGYQFKEGIEYIVYVWDTTDWVTELGYVSSCSRTAPVTVAGIDSAELGTGTTIDYDGDPPTPFNPADRTPLGEKTWLIPVVAAMIASILGLVWLVMKRVSPRLR